MGTHQISGEHSAWPVAPGEYPPPGRRRKDRCGQEAGPALHGASALPDGGACRQRAGLRVGRLTATVVHSKDQRGCKKPGAEVLTGARGCVSADRGGLDRQTLGRQKPSGPGPGGEEGDGGGLLRVPGGTASRLHRTGDTGRGVRPRAWPWGPLAMWSLRKQTERQRTDTVALRLGPKRGRKDGQTAGVTGCVERHTVQVQRGLGEGTLSVGRCLADSHVPGRTDEPEWPPPSPFQPSLLAQSFAVGPRDHLVPKGHRRHRLLRFQRLPHPSRNSGMLLELDGFHGNRAHPLGNGFSGCSCLRVTGWAVPAPVGGVGPATPPAKLPSLCALPAPHGRRPLRRRRLAGPPPGGAGCGDILNAPSPSPLRPRLQSGDQS